VQLASTGVTGSIPAETLPDEKLRIGDALEVEIASTDETLGRIDLRIIRNVH
jgi:hypothetical protein